MREEAYRRYALTTHRAGTHLATLWAVAKAYPEWPKETIVRDLIASTPGEEGKWFAAAKDAGMLPLAAELARTSPTDPRTLIRACRDYGEKHPDFALAAGLAALHWIARGHGYEIADLDVRTAWQHLGAAARHAGIDDAAVQERVTAAIAGASANGQRYVMSGCKAG